MLGALVQSYEAIPRYVPALPFFATAGLLVVVRLPSVYVSSRLEEELNSELSSVTGAYRMVLDETLPIEMKPPMLRLRLDWSIDMVLAVTAILTPIAGVAFLNPVGFASDVGLILCVVVAATIGLIFTLLIAGHVKYADWSFPKRKGAVKIYSLSLVTWVGIVLNLIAGAVAFFFAEATFISPP
jgi:hypothetical protein